MEARARRQERHEEEDDKPSLKKRIRILEEAIADTPAREKMDEIFDTSPSDIDGETFALIFPFVSVVKDSMPEYNHIEVHRDRDVFELGGHYILAKVLEVADAWPVEGGNEEEDRHFMLKLLEVLHLMSAPQSKDLTLVQGHVRYEDGPDTLSDLSEQDFGHGMDCSSDSGINGRAQLKKSWRMDIGCYTIKQKLRRIIQDQFPELVSRLDELQWAIKLVVECKEEAIKSRDMFQVFMYAISKIQASHNLGLPYDPVYTQVWNRTRWRGGLVDIKGFVLVKRGKIDKESLEDYKKNLDARKARRGHKEDSTSLLDSNELGLVLSRVEERLMRTHGCRFRDGWYPVGTVYIDTTERDFPNLRTGARGMDNPDVKHFFQVLMRTLLGNKWLRREQEDLVDAIAKRQKRRWEKRPAQAKDFLKKVFEVETRAMLDS